MILHQMDIDTASLNAPLDEEIYLLPPEGYSDADATETQEESLRPEAVSP